MNDELQEIVLLKMTAVKEGDTILIRAITPVSTVELATESEEMALQAYSQLGKRLLETIESELIELKGDMES